MGSIGYYLAWPVLQGIARLPLPLRYALSDGLYVLIHRILGYRVQVVRTNLRASFPEKSTVELRAIERRFYKWLCDLALETIGILTITPAQVMERVTLGDTGVLERYHREGRSVILVMGHWGNWELGGARFSLAGLHQLNVIYHPLENPHFDGLMYRMRTRFGTHLFAMNETLRCMLRERGTVTATAFIADQTPPPEGAYWTTFLGQDTPVFTGTEKIARKLGYPVIYVGVERTARGRYTLGFEELCANPEATAEGVISELHTRRLEADIRRLPECWLWSHRRWKHKRSSTA